MTPAGVPDAVRTAGAAPARPPGWAIWEHASEAGRGWALGLLAVSVYLPALAGGFVWDDWGFVHEPLIRRWHGLGSIWFSPSDHEGEGHYWPMVYTTFWIEHKLWGFRPFGYHAVNLVLHAVNTILVWRLLLRLGAPGAWLAAAVFAVHPVHVESVAWIIERKDLLSGLFCLWAAHAWLRHGDAPAPRTLLLSLALFAAALLSKSMAVTLPATFALLAWWRRGRVTWRDVRRLAPFCALAAGLVAWDLTLYRDQNEYAFDYSLTERALIAARALWIYVGQLAWPAELPVLYPRWEVRAGDIRGWLALSGLAGVAAALWQGRRRMGRGPFAAAAFFMVTLSPVLGFVDFSFMRAAFVADRFAYLASIGPLALAAAGAAWGLRRLDGAGHVAAVVAICGLLAAASALTWRQAQVYRDDLTLARHTAAVAPEQYFGQLRLANQLIGSGDDDRALAAGRRAVRLAEGRRGTDLAAARHTLGNAWLARDRPAEAERVFRALATGAREGSERHRAYRLDVARALARQARYESALGIYREVLANQPGHYDAHVGQGQALLESGRFAGAAHAFRQALPLVRDPTHEPPLHRLLAEALRKQGRLEDALAHLDEALRIHPRNLWVLLDRAAAGAAGRSAAPAAGVWLDRALETAQSAVTREPHSPLARVALATVLLRRGEHDAALRAVRQALPLARSSPMRRQAHRLMGEVLEARGDSATAAIHYRAALDRYPLDAEALERLAAIRFRERRHEDARPLYRRLLLARPHDAEVRADVAENLRRLGRHADAADLIRRTTGAGP